MVEHMKRLLELSLRVLGLPVPFVRSRQRPLSPPEVLVPRAVWSGFSQKQNQRCRSSSSSRVSHQYTQNHGDIVNLLPSFSGSPTGRKPQRKKILGLI